MTALPEPPAYRSSGKLAGKVALITGGNKGIGRATAIYFAREGARIAIAYLDEPAAALRTRRLVEAEGGQCLLLPGDIGSEAFAREAVEETVRTFGRLDVLINNAAEQYPQKDLLALSTQQLERTFRTNFFGYVHFTKAALAYLREGAAIINTTSVTAYQGDAQHIDYSASKGAIVSLTRSLARSLADRKIRVNAVAPGPIWAPAPDDGGEASAGEPDEVAPSYVFLASGDSSFFTGQVLHPNAAAMVSG